MDPRAAVSRDGRGETLFIDARKVGTLIDRVHGELTDADEKIVSSTGVSPVGSAKHGRDAQATYAGIPGFCKSATTAEIATNGVAVLVCQKN